MSDDSLERVDDLMCSEVICSGSCGTSARCATCSTSDMSTIDFFVAAYTTVRQDNTALAIQSDALARQNEMLTKQLKEARSKGKHLATSLRVIQKAYLMVQEDYICVLPFTAFFTPDDTYDHDMFFFPNVSVRRSLRLGAFN